MLSIEVNGQSLDIAKDISISLSLKNPMFNEIGDFAFPFKLPASRRNKSILGWKSRIENTRDIHEQFPTSVLWNGIELFSGELRPTLCNDTTYEATLYFERGNFNWQIKDLVLNQIDLGYRTFNTADEAIIFINSCLTQVYPEVELAFPMIQNLVFHDPVEDNVQLQYYNYEFADGKIHRLTDPVNQGIQQGQQFHTIIVPNVYLLHVLKKLCSNLGYTLDDRFFSNQSETKHLVLYSSYNVNGNFLYGLNFMYNNIYVPKLNVNEFLKGLETFFNCTFFVDTKKKKVTCCSNQDIVNKAGVVEFSDQIASITQEIADPVTSYLLLMSPDSSDKVYSDELDLEKPTIDWIKGSYEYLSDVPDFPFTWLGDIVYIISEDKWYQRIVVNFWAQWVILPNGPNLFDRFYYPMPQDKNKITTQFSNLMESSGCVKCGNAEADWQNIQPRLFFIDRVNFMYQGVKTLGFTYNSNLSLKYQGSVGLFNKLWKDYLDWIIYHRKYVRIEKQLTVEDILDFDFTKKYRISQMNYLIDEIQFTLTADQIKPAQIKAYSVF